MCLCPKTVVARPKDGEPFGTTVSCGKCFQCLQQKSVEWSFRIMDEASQYAQNAFLTLTYDDDHLPEDKSVSRREVQLFMKRLRKVLAPRKVRFFACGEYGEKFGRPHYHIIIFGWFPDDAYVYCKDKKGTQLFRSPLLEKVWTCGYSSVGAVTMETARYCAKYMNKVLFLGLKKDEKPVMEPFVQMSNRPGVGFARVYDCDIDGDQMYRQGMRTKIPRYYLKVMERDGIFLDDMKELRQARGEAYSRTIDIFAERRRYEEIFLKRHLVKRI